MPQFIEADVIQKIATPAEWATLLGTKIPYKGQIMLVSDGTGKVINIKVGDGTNNFASLKYMFDTIQANVNYVQVTSTALPTPTINSGFSVVGEGTYTRAGQGNVVVPAGSLGILGWNGTTWSLSQSVVLPKGADGQGIVPLFDSNKAGGYLKDAQVRSSNGAIFISQKDSNTDPISNKTSWIVQSLAPIDGIVWKCKEYNLNNGSGLVTGKYLNDNGTIATGNGGYIVIPITSNLIGKPIYIDGFTISQFSSGQGVGNYAFYDDSDMLVANGGVEFYGRYNLIPNGATKLLIGVARLVTPTQVAVDAIKVSISFNRINENGKDCYITDIKTIANAVPKTHIKHNLLAFARGRRTVANITNPTDFYAYQHLDTQIVEVTNNDKILWVYKLSNNLNAYGAICYDKDWNILSTSDSLITTSIPGISDPSSFIVNYNSVNETVYETPFLVPANCRYVVFGILTNTAFSDRFKALTTISSKKLSANDFPVISFEYNIELYNDITSYKDVYDIDNDVEYINMASLSTLSNGRYDANGSLILNGQNVKFNVEHGNVYSVIVTSTAVSSSEIGLGIYTDINNINHPLNLSNFSRVIIGNNGDTWSQPIRLYQIIPQSDWKSISVNTTTSNFNRYFAIFKGVYNGYYLPYLNETISKNELMSLKRKFQNNNLTVVGDSITYQMMWQKYINFKTGLAFDFNEIRFGKNGYRPMGVGGSMIYPDVTGGVVPNPSTNKSITCRSDDAKYYSPKFLMLMGGRNDLGKNIVIGDATNPPLLDYNNPPMTTGIAYSSSNPSDTVGATKTGLSFASCYRRIIIKWLQDIPSAKIICLTPFSGNDGPRNMVELKAIRKVIFDICSDYGVQVIDTFSGSQINSLNYLTFAPDGVHINDDGGKMLSNYINPYIV